MEAVVDISGQVIVHKHPETGMLITKSKSGKAFGYMVKSSQMVWTTTASGMTVQDIKTRAAFVVVPDKLMPVNDGGTIKQMLLSDYFIATKIVEEGKSLPGKIVVREQLVPFPNADGTPGNPEYNLKANPQTGEVCQYMGFNVYRKHIYFEDLKQEDELAHQWAERTGFKVNFISAEPAHKEVERWRVQTDELLEQVSCEEYMQKEFAA